MPEKFIMGKKSGKFYSVLFLLLFCLPSVVRLEHHHNHSFYELKGEKRYPVLQNNCPICNFEYPVFISAVEKIAFQSQNPVDNWYNLYAFLHCSDLSKLVFSLRGPPHKCN